MRVPSPERGAMRVRGGAQAAGGGGRRKGQAGAAGDHRGAGVQVEVGGPQWAGAGLRTSAARGKTSPPDRSLRLARNRAPGGVTES